jgi:hypothetical protein
MPFTSNWLIIWKFRTLPTTNPMPTKIETLWAVLETDPTAGQGLYYRRYAATIKPDVFVGIRRSASGIGRLLAVGLPVPVMADALTLHDLALTIEPDTARPGRQLVLLTLTNPAHTDLFAVVCEDLITQIADETDPASVLTALLKRLEQWTALFENRSPDGLSAEKKQGLYGELWFLQRWLDTGANPDQCLTAWTGPGGSVHDFQLSDKGIELKTTSAVNPQTVQISNERQLDDSGLTYLWLWLLTLDVRPTGGQSLNQLIDALLDQLNTYPAALNQYRLRLYQAGYQPHQRDLYDAPTYAVRSEQVYQVRDGFPRLRISDLPPGVSAVRYAVTLLACLPFAVLPDDVLPQL